MEEIIGIGFKTGMIIAGSFAIIGYLIGSLMNLLNYFGRG